MLVLLMLFISRAGNFRMVDIEINGLSPLFLISRLNIACSPLVVNLQSWELLNGNLVHL